MPAAEISTPCSSAWAMLTLSVAFPSRSGKSSLTLRNRLGSEDSARGTAAKESARRTDSRELPAELARQQRSLWQGAVCALHATIHSPGAGAQLPRCECCANLWPTAPDRKTGKGCAIGRWPQPGPIWPDARLAPERFPRQRRLALSCPCRSRPSPASAALFLLRQGLAVSAMRE